MRLLALLTDEPARPGIAPVAAPSDLPIGLDALRDAVALIVCARPAVFDSVDGQVVVALLRVEGFHPKRLAARRLKRAALAVTVVAGVVRRVDALAGYDARAGHDGEMYGEGVRWREGRAVIVAAYVGAAVGARVVVIVVCLAVHRGKCQRDESEPALPPRHLVTAHSLAVARCNNSRTATGLRGKTTNH